MTSREAHGYLQRYEGPSRRSQLPPFVVCISGLSRLTKNGGLYFVCVLLERVFDRFDFAVIPAVWPGGCGRASDGRVARGVCHVGGR